MSHRVISAVVITKNEAPVIAGCLESLKFTDEIIVVDAQSEDETVAIASGFTSKIFIREWMGFAAAKQFAVEQASGDWIFWIDADEMVTPELAEEIQKIRDAADPANGYKMPRKAWFLGRWIMHSGWYPGYVLRLFRKESGRFSSDRVHEKLVVEGRIGTLKGEIEHYTDKSIGHYLTKFNRYTSLAAADLADRNKRFKLTDLLIRPIHTFMKMYVFKAGFRDGIQGFLLAVFSACYVFTKYAKLWEIRRGLKE